MDTKNLPYLIIFLVAALLFLPFLGQVHLFDWDEINFAESAREMLLTGNWTRVMVDFQPFWEKPPFFIWLQALSMKLFGVEAFSARLPNAICGIFTLIILFRIGYKLFDKFFGLLWVLAYAGSFLPHFYFKSGIIDPIFNLFIFLGLYWLIKMTSPEERTLKQTRYYSILAGIFVGLAVLTKGPVGLLMPILTGLGYWAYYRFKPLFYWSHVGLFLLFTIIVSSAWYGLETIKNGFWFLIEFIDYQIHLLSQEGAGHGGPWYYHFVVLLIGCFPASIFALGGLYDRTSITAMQRHFKIAMVFLLAAVLITFSIVETKIVHYSSLAYFPITYLSAHFCYQLLKSKVVHWRAYQTFLLVLIGGVMAIALSVLPFFGKHPEWILPYVEGSFAKGNLQADVFWSGWESLIGLFYLVVIGLSTFFLLKKQFRLRGIVALFCGSILTIQLAVYVFVPKIEKYTQNTAIQFYKNLQGKDVYVEVLGFKSYAHLFYSRKKPENASERIDKSYLLNGPIQKPAYFVVKNHDLKDYFPSANLKLLDRKNGFVFLKRPAKVDSKRKKKETGEEKGG